MSAQRPDVGQGLAVGGIAVLAILCIFPAVWLLIRFLADAWWGRRMVDRWYREHSSAHCRARRTLASEVRSATERLATIAGTHATERCRHLVETARKAMDSVEQAFELDRFIEWAPKEDGHPRIAGNEFVRAQIRKVLQQADCLEYEGKLMSKALHREVKTYRQAIVDLGLNLATIDASRPRREKGKGSLHTPLGLVARVARNLLFLWVGLCLVSAIVS